MVNDRLYFTIFGPCTNHVVTFQFIVSFNFCSAHAQWTKLASATQCFFSGFYALSYCTMTPTL